MDTVSLATTSITAGSLHPPPPPRRNLYILPHARYPSPFLLAFLDRRHSSSVQSRKSVPVFCGAVEGNSTPGSSVTADADPSPQEQTAELNDGGDSSSQDLSNEVKEQESLGKALREARQESMAAGNENPSKTEEFWQGVLEETRLIEWPSLQKVLSTTGVVTSIIVGSSLVLLTVNALLAELSDVVFKNTPPV